VCSLSLFISSHITFKKMRFFLNAYCIALSLVEIDIYRKLTPRLHNIKVQLGECPAINSDMHVNVEVDVESCQVHFHLSYLSEIHACISELIAGHSPNWTLILCKRGVNFL
jgi:hypothetical protein